MVWENRGKLSVFTKDVGMTYHGYRQAIDDDNRVDLSVARSRHEVEGWSERDRDS